MQGGVKSKRRLTFELYQGAANRHLTGKPAGVRAFAPQTPISPRRLRYTDNGGTYPGMVTPAAGEATAELSTFTNGVDREQLLRAFRLMYLSRRIDDREITLKRQNRIFFQVSGAGHEAIQIAAGMALRPRYDWFYMYYRDRALALTLGVTAEDMMLQSVGAATDRASGGRQMPSHWSSPELHIVTGSSPTGTQFAQAAGCANASSYTSSRSDEVTLVCTGEGATSE